MISEITKNTAFPPCSNAAEKALVACAARKVSPTRRAKIISRFFRSSRGIVPKIFNFFRFDCFLSFFALTIGEKSAKL